MSEVSDRSPAPDDRFVKAFAAAQRSLYGYIYSLLPHRSDAEDVFQKTCMVLWKRFDRYDPERGTFKAWACGVAYYEVLEFKRMSSRNRLYFDDELMGLIADEREAGMKERDARLDKLEYCREKLPERDRSLVREIYEYGVSMVEFASRNGFAAQTLYNRMNRIRRQLYLCINKADTI